MTGRRHSVSQCFQHWLDVKRTRVRELTWRDYEEKARRYLLPRLGLISVRSLTPARITGYYATLREEGLSPRSVWYVHEILMQVLDHAVALRLIALNPARLLLIDEPSKGLSPRLVSEMVTALARIAKDTTVLLVEQNLAAVHRLADHVLAIADGRIVHAGPAAALLHDATLTRQLLGVSARAGVAA